MSGSTDVTFPRERSGHVGQVVEGDVEEDPYAFVEVESLPGVGGEDPAGSGGGVEVQSGAVVTWDCAIRSAACLARSRTVGRHP